MISQKNDALEKEKEHRKILLGNHDYATTKKK